MLSLSPAKWARILVPIAAGLLLLAAACGGDDDDGGNGGNGNGDTTTPTATATADEIQSQPDSAQEVGNEVTEAVGGVLQTAEGDNFFTLNNLKVPLNETTTFEINNVGGAVHNMRIAGPDGEWNTDDDSVSNPDQLAPDESGVLEFTPTLTGTYTFRCDFHPTQMGGVIVVE